MCTFNLDFNYLLHFFQLGREALVMNAYFSANTVDENISAGMLPISFGCIIYKEKPRSIIRSFFFFPERLHLAIRFEYSVTYKNFNFCQIVFYNLFPDYFPGFVLRYCLRIRRCHKCHQT